MILVVGLILIRRPRGPFDVYSFTLKIREPGLLIEGTIEGDDNIDITDLKSHGQGVL